MKNLMALTDCPRSLRAAIRSYWGEKDPRFERLLASFHPESRALRLFVRRSRAGWNAKAVLSLGGRTLVGRKEAPHWYEALDMAADQLALEIRRYKERLQLGHRRRKHPDHRWLSAS